MFPFQKSPASQQITLRICKNSSRALLKSADHHNGMFGHLSATLTLPIDTKQHLHRSWSCLLHAFNAWNLGKKKKTERKRAKMMGSITMRAAQLQL